MSKQTEKDLKFKSLIKIGLTEAEAKEVCEADDRIDKGEKLFELSAEGKEAEKKYKNCGTRTVKSPYGQTLQKEKKTDEDKRLIIDVITEALEQNCGKVSIENPERELTFIYNDRKFKVALSCPRS